MVEVARTIVLRGKKMMNGNNKIENITNMKQLINEVFKESELLKNNISEIRNAAEQTKFEKQIAKIIDRLASLLTAKAIQETLDSEQPKQRSSEEVIKLMPIQMKDDPVT
jgi:regulator of replication initiation timing